MSRAARLKRFSPRQMQALCWWCDRSPWRDKTAVICDGAVRSGKTLCMSISFVCWAMYRFADGDFALCGKTARALRRNLVTPLLPVLRQLGFGTVWRSDAGELEVSARGRTNRFYVFGGQNEGSAALIQGVTLCGALLDEVALMPRSFVEQTVARCSAEGAKLWFACNPEGPDHWFYREWIQGAETKNALYLHFLMEDNPALSEKTRARYRRQFSGVFYRRFVLGEWTRPQGLIYPFMDGMLVDPPEGAWEELVVSCDYGTANPCSFGLWGRLGRVWYRFDEYYYDGRLEERRRTDGEHLQALLALLRGRRPRAVIVDPSAASFVELLNRQGLPAIPAKNEVADGIRRTAEALKSGRVRICRCCADTVREFGLYRWDERSAADTPVKEHDHAMDDIRYFVSTWLAREDGADGFLAVCRPA